MSKSKAKVTVDLTAYNAAFRDYKEMMQHLKENKNNEAAINKTYVNGTINGIASFNGLSAGILSAINNQVNIANSGIELQVVDSHKALPKKRRALNK